MFSKGVIIEKIGIRSTSSSQATNPHVNQWVEVSDRKGLHLVVEFLNKLGPVFQTDLENLSVLDLRDSDKVEVAMSEVIPIGKVLNKLS